MSHSTRDVMPTTARNTLVKLRTQRCISTYSKGIYLSSARHPLPNVLICAKKRLIKRTNKQLHFNRDHARRRGLATPGRRQKETRCWATIMRRGNVFLVIIMTDSLLGDFTDIPSHGEKRGKSVKTADARKPMLATTSQDRAATSASCVLRTMTLQAGIEALYVIRDRRVLHLRGNNNDPRDLSSFVLRTRPPASLQHLNMLGKCPPSWRDHAR